MGYMRHHAIIVTASNPHLDEAHGRAQGIFGDLVSSPVEANKNGYLTFVVAPDGSKEGWQESISGDHKRADFVEWLDDQRDEDNSTPIDWVEVQYGDDEHETKIVSDSDSHAREETK